MYYLSWGIWKVVQVLNWWKTQVAKIEQCAQKNGVLEIDVPEKEWKRLKKEGLASLKPLLSENAFCRLVLLDVEAPKRYYLLIAHLGHCR